jgi:hypothetical protein
VLDLHRDGDLAVPQDLHCEARVDVEPGQQWAACLAGPVHGDGGNLGVARGLLFGGNGGAENAADPSISVMRVPGRAGGAGRS